ncbi:MAG: hypothetical protein KL863_19750 [Rhizobium sp.]|nr:hypothetical protein [Rhizobium sp.]
MSRGALYGLIAVLLVVVLGGGLYLYNEETKPGVELKANEDGISLETN